MWCVGLEQCAEEGPSLEECGRGTYGSHGVLNGSKTDKWQFIRTKWKHRGWRVFLAFRKRWQEAWCLVRFRRVIRELRMRFWWIWWAARIWIPRFGRNADRKQEEMRGHDVFRTVRDKSSGPHLVAQNFSPKRVIWGDFGDDFGFFFISPPPLKNEADLGNSIPVM